MANEIESQELQESIVPETQVPVTPPPLSAPNQYPDTTGVEQATSSATSGPKAIASPLPSSSSINMTPPPSSQIPSLRSPRTRPFTSQSRGMPDSPPPTIKIGQADGLPTDDHINGLDDNESKQVAKELRAALSEERTRNAHLQLQHNLLSIETRESAQKAEIEHQMMQREVEVLQAAHVRQKAIAASHRNMQAGPLAQNEALLARVDFLEKELEAMNRKLLRAMKVLEEREDRLQDADEEIARLKKRIRDNRDHFNRMRMQSPIQFSPRTEYATPQRKVPPQFSSSARSQGGNSDAFAYLLAADQVLSQEPASVPSTPTKTSSSKGRHGHLRGAQSLSSLQTTPQSRPVTSDHGFSTPQNRAPIDPRIAYSAPVSQVVKESMERSRRDRDSTISVSDSEEEAVTDEDVPPSSASDLATSMLRRNPGSQEERTPASQTEKSSNLLQSKLFGNIRKPGSDRPELDKKRVASGGEDRVAVKKARIREGVGLGIGSWGRSKA
ncbi:MAG: hypothetical protein Q9227_007113 [Pyrenula ochraceoflavens]